MGPPGRFDRFGAWVVRRRRRLIIGWIVGVVALAVGFSGTFSENLTAATGTTPGSESDRARALLEDEFGLGEREQDLLVFRASDITVEDSAYGVTVERAIASIVEHPAVVSVESPLEPGHDAKVSADGRAAFATVAIEGDPLDRQDVAAELAAALDTVESGEIDVWLTGESPLVHDVDGVAQDDLAQAEMIGLPLALLVLLLAFGALVAAGLPLLLAGFGIGATFGILGLLSMVTEFNLLTENITTLVGLGVGIDFAMFIVARFREAMNDGSSPERAAEIAISTSGRSVLFSAGTTVVAMSGLFLVDSPIFWDLAIAVMVTVTVMVAAALTLLPAVLASLGRRVEKGRLPWRSSAGIDVESGRWASVAAAVMRRPGMVTMVTGALVLAMAAPALGLELGMSSGAEAVAAEPSGQGLAVLEEHFGEGAVSPIDIVIDDPDGVGGRAERVAVSLVDALRADVDVATAELVTVIPGGAHVSVASVPAPDSNEAEALVRRLRDSVVPSLDADGVDVAVGGLTAGIIDQSDEMASKLPAVIGFVLLVTFALLLSVFRSPVLAAKAIVMNLVSVGAAYGLVVVVFQHGLGESVLGFTSPGYIQSYLPLFAFVVLFGISMDYELFLLGRMREEWVRTGDNTLAVTRGMQRTARPITSAAAIQASIFGAFAFTSVIDVQQIGFALAAAILVDATIVRALLVPATMKLMGRWNWWTPRWLERRGVVDGARSSTPGRDPGALAAAVSEG